MPRFDAAKLIGAEAEQIALLVDIVKEVKEVREEIRKMLLSVEHDYTDIALKLMDVQGLESRVGLVAAQVAEDAAKVASLKSEHEANIYQGLT